MTKMLDASCLGGVVTVEGFPVPSAVILSEGIAESEGFLLIEEDKAKYITSSAQDLKETIEQLVDILGDITSALQSIDTVSPLITTCGAGPGTAIWIPVATAAIAQINAGAAELTTLKEMLK